MKFCDKDHPAIAYEDIKAEDERASWATCPVCHWKKRQWEHRATIDDLRSQLSVSEAAHISAIQDITEWAAWNGKPSEQVHALARRDVVINADLLTACEFLMERVDVAHANRMCEARLTNNYSAARVAIAEAQKHSKSQG